MKKQLSEEEFQAAIDGLEIGKQTIQIAHGVLVEGAAQANFVRSLGITKGAVSQAVRRVWMAHIEKNLPKGYEKVTAILPEHQAFVVRKWSKEAQKRLESKEPTNEDIGSGKSERRRG